MRLLTVGSLPPEWGGKTRGGVATFHQTFLTELADGAYAVDLAGVFMLNHDSASGSEPDRVRLWRQPEGVPDREWWPVLLDHAVPDVVLFFHIGHRWARIHAQLGRPPPAVGSVRSWHQVTFQSDPERAASAREVLQEALGGLAGVHFPSDHSLSEGLKLGFDWRCPSFVIPNHVAPWLFHHATGGARSGVVFVGSLIPRKRPDLVIRAAAELEIPAVIVGSGPMESQLRELADDLTCHVEFTGELSLSQVADTVARSEALCVPSESESFGNVYTEALALGVPVVGFAPTLSEIGTAAGLDVGVGLAEPTADSVTAGLEDVLSQQWDRQVLRDAMLRAFSPPVIVDRYVRMLSECATRGSSLNP